MPGDIPLATAFVRLESDDTGLKASMLEQIRRVQAAMPPVKIKVEPDLGDFAAKVRAGLAKALADTGGSIKVPLKLQADSGMISRELTLLRQRMQQAGVTDFLDASLPIGKMQYQIALLKRLLSQGSLSRCIR